MVFPDNMYMVLSENDRMSSSDTLVVSEGMGRHGHNDSSINSCY